MDLKLGQVAAPGTTGIRVVNADILKVKADVPESYSGTVNAGDNVKILIPDANDSLITRVTFAAKVIDPLSRSFGVEVKLPNRKNLRPNMTAVIKIANYSKSNALFVPVNSIQKSEAGDYVFVNANGIAKRKNVKEGATSAGFSSAGCARPNATSEMQSASAERAQGRLSRDFEQPMGWNLSEGRPIVALRGTESRNRRARGRILKVNC